MQQCWRTWKTHELAGDEGKHQGLPVWLKNAPSSFVGSTWAH